MTRHRRPRPRLTRTQALTLLATATIAAAWIAAITYNAWAVVVAVLFAGVGVALSFDTPEDQ